MSRSASEAEAARHFERNIAPLFARRCLECHGPDSKKGRLDLSRKDAALAGGENGAAIVPGKADDSLLWQFVDSDEMPKDRTPLSDRDKQLLREWIDAGAIWSGGAIDPQVYTGDRGAADNRVQRLTVPEYIETVQSALGVDIEQDARRILPPDLRADGFSNTAYNLNVDLGHVEAYAQLARIIVGRMDVAAFAAEFSNRQDLAEPHMRQVISRMGKWLLRGPLDDHEVAAYLRVSQAVAEEGGDFTEAVRFLVEAMLQSPRFIYRVERQPDGDAPQSVGHYELASRLSYILWGGPPDKELMRAADAGELSDRSRVRAQVERMFNDPRAIERSLWFAEEWLNLHRLRNLRPNPERFPRWDSQLAADMRDETLAFFQHVAWEQQRPLWDLMNAQVTFATPRLAEHYGLDWSHAAAVKQVAGPSPEQNEKPRQRPSAQRVTGGLLVLYTFEESGGKTVRDVAGAGEPLNLDIEDPAAVRWGRDGLTVHSGALIASAGRAKKLFDAVKKSNSISLEAWVIADNTSQSGPARIVTLSADPNARNVTLGQDGDKFDVRLRTTKTSGNGIPSSASRGNSVQTRPTHVVYTRDTAGKAVFYVNGEQQSAGNVGGNLSNWDGRFRLALANELSKDRPWLGTLQLVAVYDRALSAKQVQQNHAAGPRPQQPAALAAAVPEGVRSQAGLQALYTFQESGGKVIRDTSGAGEPLDLQIEDASAVAWEQGQLTVKGPTLIATAGPATRLIDAAKKSKAVTLEAWITPDDTSQSGPARILTLSDGTGQRNFTLGQEGDRFDVRFRATKTDGNGLPSLSSPRGAVATRPTHVVYTRDASGRAKLYVDGEHQAAGNVDGLLSNWDDGFRLALANETTQDRPWRGTLHRVAIYSRALTPDEVRMKGPGLSPYELAKVPGRGGLLTQGSVLTIGGDEASMVTRGLFVLHDLLWGEVDDPPPCVDTTPVPTKPGLSQRAIAEARIANEACGGCHGTFEPFAFGLEKFDGLGAYHERDEHGNRLRDDGRIVFPDADQPVSYESSAELMNLLAGSERVRMGITRKVTQFALGRPLLEADVPILERIHDEAKQNGGTYASLITAIVLSDLVQKPRSAAD